MARNYAALPYDYLEETGEQIALCGNERFYAKRVMAQEDRFKASYDGISATRSEAGKAGAVARWQNSKRIFANGKNSKATFANDKNGNTETKTDTETNTPLSDDSKGDKRAKRFVPPTLEEVRAYVAECHSPVDPQRFIDFYASKGWMVGKNKMKDWKAACRNAEKWDEWEYSAQKSTKSMPTATNSEQMKRSVEEYMDW